MLLVALVTAIPAYVSSAAAEPPRLVVQTGHSGHVAALAFSGDGTLLASASNDKYGNGEIKLWDVAAGRELRTITALRYEIVSLALDPAGRTVATGGTNGRVRLWDVTTGQQDGSLEGKQVAISRDGTILVSVVNSRTVRLWNVATRQPIRALVDDAGWLPAMAYAPDGQTLILATRDLRIVAWDLRTGSSSTRGTAQKSAARRAAFSSAGALLAATGPEGTLALFDAMTGVRLWALRPSSAGPLGFALSGDGGFLATGGTKGVVTLWDATTGLSLRTMDSGGTSDITLLEFSPDASLLATAAQDGAISLWDVATGRRRTRLSRHAQGVARLAFRPDGRVLAHGHEHRTVWPWDTTVAEGAPEHSVRLWNLAVGRGFRSLRGHGGDVFTVDFNADGTLLASGSIDKSVRLWDVATGTTIRTLPSHSEAVTSVAFAPDGRTLVSGDYTGMLRLWDVATGALVRSVGGSAEALRSVAFNPDGTLLATTAETVVRLWDVASGDERGRLRGHAGHVNAAEFSPDGGWLVSGATDGTIRLWDAATGAPLRTMSAGRVPVTSIVLNPKGTKLASGDDAGTVRLWDVATGQQLLTLAGHSGRVNSVAFHPQGEVLASGSIDNTIKLWETVTGKLLASLVALDSEDWVVLTPEGRFDASSTAVTLLHWVVGNEPIALSQLKERYYEPGLLAKVLGFSKEPLRDVTALSANVGLYPRVEYTLPRSPEEGLTLKLTNRGGGIGRVQVLVNDKEVSADARAPGIDPSAAEASITVDLKGAPWVPGQANRVQVVAWNSEGYLASRGVERVWTPPGAVDTPPQLYAILAGVSSYASPSLALRYAAKDAEDMAAALAIGARRLFGPDRVHVSLLTTSGQHGGILPSKANFKKAFDAARQARPWDVLFVYLAGHALALGGGQDSYCYLTTEARSPDLSDPAVRGQVALTSEELVEWVKQIPALKQVMVLDTCAAGTAALKLTEKRDVGSSQIRALERLKDRTGFHVLMGSTADAASYEASQYGQGLLTYALLQGMRGAALRDDEYVDVSRLFQYAVDQVPELARHVGGIQRPIVAAPGGTSFDVGRLIKSDKEAIPMTMVKPLVLRPVLLNSAEGLDDLELMAMVRSGLRDASSPTAGQAPTFVYVDEDELPGAISPSGTYTVQGEDVKLRLVLARDGRRLSEVEVSGPKSDTTALLTRILDVLVPALRSVGTK